MYYDYLRETYEKPTSTTRNLRVPRETYEKPTRNLRVPQETYEKPTRNLRETYEYHGKPTRKSQKSQKLSLFHKGNCIFTRICIVI